MVSLSEYPMREHDLFQPSGLMATIFLVRCAIHTEGAVGRREGFVVFELESRWTLAFHHVLYVPRLRANVLLVSSLENQGYTVDFRGYPVQLWTPSYWGTYLVSSVCVC